MDENTAKKINKQLNAYADSGIVLCGMYRIAYVPHTQSSRTVSQLQPMCDPANEVFLLLIQYS